MIRLRLEALRYQGRGPIDLTVESGECVGLFGPSGSGKTLLLRALADLDPHEGKVLLDEVESLELDAPAWRCKVGLLPAESHWWKDTVGEHFPREEASWLAWLEALGLGRETMAWPVSRLSTGERQRLAIVRLLVNRPRVLLLDEPTASLDPDNVECVERLIAAYRESTAAAVLWVSHESRQIARVAGRGFELVEGRLREAPR